MERKDGPLRGISESFVLVPNKEEVGAKGTGKGDHGRKWLIQTQNFRIVV
jgi:NTF2-related export protein 1/2